jgi:hypothetical protein
VIAGASSTVKENACDASVPIPLVAVIVSGYVPPVPASGVPEITPVVKSNVTPPGSGPASVNVGAGKPVAVTVKLPSEPTVNVVAAALVIAGASLTVSVNDWVASLPTPFDAVNVIGYVPPVPASGVPDNMPVVVSNITPDGNGPDSDKVGVGKPVAVTVKCPSEPTVNVVDVAVVIAGASSTVKENACDASVPIPLCAVIVSG